MSVSREWDAATYDRVSDPQLELGLEVLDRAALRGDERVLDAGCGSGRVTAAIAERVPRGEVVAVDGSPAMVREASARLGAAVPVLGQDLQELTLADPVDVIISTATFHWIPDHPRLFAALHAALVPGGRLIAQCGGEGNIARFERATEAVMEREPYATHFDGWRHRLNFAAPAQASEMLSAAGFSDVEAWLEPRDVAPPDPPAYLRAICLRLHADRLPAAVVPRFVDDVLSELARPPLIDYVRLNLAARRPG